MRRCIRDEYVQGALLFGCGLFIGLLFPLAPLLFISALLIIAAAVAARRR